MQSKHCYDHDFYHLLYFYIQVLLKNYQNIKKSNLKLHYYKRCMKSTFLKSEILTWF